MPSQKVLKNNKISILNNKISILNNKISIFCDSLVSSQKVKPVTKSIKKKKYSFFFATV